MDEDKNTMTVKETCVALGISRDTLYRRMKQKVIEPIPRNHAQIRTPLRFNRADVDALRRQRPSPAPPAREE